MQRLKDKRGYKLLKQSTLKSVSNFFLIVYLFDSALQESLAGITVSKKVGNAVTRNKIKRRIKAFLIGFKPREETPRFLCNIIALQPVVMTDWQVFCHELQRCLWKVETGKSNGSQRDMNISVLNSNEEKISSDVSDNI